MPKIENFPYTLGLLVTCGSKQIQNVLLSEDRLLNREEHNLVERLNLGFPGIMIASPVKSWSSVLPRLARRWNIRR